MLFVSDGTAAGTHYTTTSATDPDYLVAAGSTGKVYFAATSSTSGREIWVSDGTAAGTTQIADIAAGAASSSPTNLGLYYDAGSHMKIFFGANDGSVGNELWSFDNAPVGTTKTFTTAEDTTLNITAASGLLVGATDSDGDPMTVVLKTGVAHGTLTLNANGTLFIPCF